MTSTVKEFIKTMKHPVKFRMFLFWRLPSAFFSGVRIREMDEFKCAVSVPYKWFSQNPFRSTYFACLAMAAEMSTGAIAMAYLFKRKPHVSMLVTKLESHYEKKATGVTIFTCMDGQQFNDAIELAITSKEPQSFTARSVGRNPNGETIAVFLITWSFKVKS